MANTISAPPVLSTAKRERIGKYAFLRELGAEGSERVYASEDPDSRQPVVVKLLERQDRFIEEGALLTRIQHEHLVPVLDAGEDDGQPYLVMELLKGETLSARLKREHKLPLQEAVRIAQEAAAGLAFVHAHGLIHFDICPQNIWLEPMGRARLLGLGAAPRENTLLDRLSGPGTPGYMSPEQAAGEPASPASDTFGLGAVLYHMATGEAPFRGEGDQALIRSTVFDQPQSPSQINPDIPEAIDELIVRMLAKIPNDRPESMKEVDRFLVEWLQPAASLTAPALPKLPEPDAYPASKRILDSLNSLKLDPTPASAPLPTRWQQEEGLAPPLPAPKRPWMADLIAALLLIAGAFGLYLWWKASNEPKNVDITPPVKVAK